MKTLTYFICAIFLAACSKKDELPVISPIDMKYQNPSKFIGMPLSFAADHLGVVPKSNNTIIIDNEQLYYLIESNDGRVSFVDVELKETTPCSIKEKADSDKIIEALFFEGSREYVEKARSQQNGDIYYDHTSKLKISVICHQDAGAVSLSVSKKYYLH